MRFLCNEDVFILVEHPLPKRYNFFIFQLAVIENASANSKSGPRIDATSDFIPYLTPRHPCLPGCGVHVRILFFEIVENSFPWTCWKPLAAWSNSFDKGKRSVQIKPVNCYVSLNNGSLLLMTLRHHNCCIRASQHLKHEPLYEQSPQVL